MLLVGLNPACSMIFRLHSKGQPSTVMTFFAARVLPKTGFTLVGNPPRHMIAAFSNPSSLTASKQASPLVIPVLDAPPKQEKTAFSWVLTPASHCCSSDSSTRLPGKGNRNGCYFFWLRSSFSRLLMMNWVTSALLGTLPEQTNSSLITSPGVVRTW
jgi:hypothetical protein